MRPGALAALLVASLVTQASASAPLSPSAAAVESAEPPYLSSEDGIAASNEPLLPGKNETRVRLAGTSGEGTEIANVLLRIEGRGDASNTVKGQQTAFIYDNSGSMDWNDPDRLRCDAMKAYADRMKAPSELAAVEFWDQAVLKSALTTDYEAVKASLSCEAHGDNEFHLGFRVANDELIPKRKPSFAWAEIMLTDGQGQQDPVPEIERAARAGVRVFTICLSRGCWSENLDKWSRMAGGASYNVEDARDLRQVYDAINQMIGAEKLAATPPPSGPMVTLKLRPDIEVVPGSFSIAPSRPEEVQLGNRGLLLEWGRPEPRMQVGQRLDLTFSVRAYRAGEDIEVNDANLSTLAYTTFDGLLGTASFPQLRLDVWEPSTPPSPGLPPSFGLPLPAIRLEAWQLGALLLIPALLCLVFVPLVILRRRRRRAMEDATVKERAAGGRGRRARAAKRVAAGRLTK